MDNNKESYIQNELKRIEDNQRTNKAIFLTSSAVSLFSAALALGNFASGNELSALQNTGMTIAMGCYTVGYHHLYEINEAEKRNKVKEGESNTSYLTDLKCKLIRLKTSLDRTKTYKNMNIIVGTGFSLAAISNIIRCIHPETGDNLLLSSLGACLAGFVAFLNYAMIKRHNSLITTYNTEIEHIEDLIEQEECSKKAKK